MENIRIEYVWIDTQLRIKTKILYVDLRRYNSLESYMDETPRYLSTNDYSKIPIWKFDDIKTEQEDSYNLIPSVLYKNPFKDNSYIVLCEVTDSNDISITVNNRSALINYLKIFKGENKIGIKQEYFISTYNKEDVSDSYYCDIYSSDKIVDEHLYACLKMGISIDSVNSTTCKGKWIYQLTEKNIITICDDLWMSRLLLHMICVKYNVIADTISSNTIIRYNGTNIIINGNIDLYNIILKIIKGEK
jgi:glutamine synthetase